MNTVNETVNEKITELAGIFCLPGTVKNVDVINHGNINASYDVT